MYTQLSQREASCDMSHGGLSIIYDRPPCGDLPCEIEAEYLVEHGALHSCIAADKTALHRELSDTSSHCNVAVLVLRRHCAGGTSSTRHSSMRMYRSAFSTRAALLGRAPRVGGIRRCTSSSYAIAISFMRGSSCRLRRSCGCHLREIHIHTRRHPIFIEVIGLTRSASRRCSAS